MQRVDQATASMDAMDAWELEDRARAVLSGAGVAHAGAKVGSLSGGRST